MTIEIPDSLVEPVEARAEAIGLSLEQCVFKVLEQVLNEEQNTEPLPPFKTGYGMWKKYGVCISDEEIAENRADMFRGFGEDS